MATLSLSTIPAGASVLIDANIFVYAFNRKSPQCTEFLRRCAAKELSGLITFETIHEATHQFMLVEAVAKGLLAKPSAAQLNAKPAVVASLSEYWQHARSLFALGLTIAPCTESIVVRAQTIRQTTGLLTNDSLLVATMLEIGVPALASSDRAFERAPAISLYSPTDLP